jgi:penicillin amidase
MPAFSQLGAMISAVLPVFRAVFPPPRAFAERLSQMPTGNLPLHGPVAIRWNDLAVPFIQAANDHDLAFALGLVHAHLREAQLAMAKRVVHGRIAEMAGPRARDVDLILRILDFPHAAAAVEAAMPPETLGWMRAFLDGLNFYQDHASAQPPEYALLGIRRERWSLRDLLAIGRLGGADINWLVYLSLIRHRDAADWPAVWQRALAAGGASETGGAAAVPDAALARVLLRHSRPGSNCVVVAPSHSTSGGALLACNPHLPLALPNVWLLAGVASPRWRAVGLMPPGLPFFALGRSEHMAWGGTNMRAASSDLYDVSREPPGSIASRPERIRTRFWFDRRAVVRRSRLGPIVSDIPRLRARPGTAIALRWMGHQPSDEITAFLRLMRARSPADFRAAFASYGVSGQNMQFADRDGNIGQIMAAWLPRREGGPPPDLILDPRSPSAEWRGHATAEELPWVLNPAAGFLASANNAPPPTDPPAGYFFSARERVERLRTLLARREKLSLDDLRALHLDVVSTAAARLAAMLVDALDDAGVATDRPEFVARLRGWAGSYAASAVEPVAFETLLYHVAHGLGARWPDAGWTHLLAFLQADLAALAVSERTVLLRKALSDAAGDAARFANWGEMHRMRVRSVLANIPLIGAAFRLDDYPVGGSRETVMKTAHGLVRTRHAVAFGAQARFLADLADPDATYGVLFGGQDGWLGSANYADQMTLWKTGHDVRLPLTQAAVEREFPHVQHLGPAGR